MSVRSPSPVADPTSRIGTAALGAALLGALLLASPTPARAGCSGSAVSFWDDFETGTTPIAWTAPWLGGHSVDFWSGATLEGSTLTLAAPARADTSRVDGRFHLVDLAGETAGTVIATRAAGYRATTNGPVVWGAGARACDLFSISSADAARQYVTAGLTETAGNAIVVALLADSEGEPLEGIPAADISLTDDGLSPIGLGPYFFGSGGDIDSGLTVSTAFGGRVAFAYLDVPAGTAVLSVASVEPEEEDSETFTVSPGGANVVFLGGPD